MTITDIKRHETEKAGRLTETWERKNTAGEWKGIGFGIFKIVDSQLYLATY